jgi:hypothetical protein
MQMPYFAESGRARHADAILGGKWPCEECNLETITMTVSAFCLSAGPTRFCQCFLVGKMHGDGGFEHGLGAGSHADGYFALV